MELARLGGAEVGELLDGLGLGRYRAAFAAGGVDGRALLSLDWQRLARAGMGFKPHQRKLLRWLDGASSAISTGVGSGPLALAVANRLAHARALRCSLAAFAPAPPAETVENPPLSFCTPQQL